MRHRRTFALLLCALGQGCRTRLLDMADPSAADAILDPFHQLLVVPVDGSSVQSNTLRGGVAYRLEASGTFEVGGLGVGDAEYAFNPDHSQIVDKCTSGEDLGMAIDDSGSGPEKLPRWGAFSDRHQYETRMVGADRGISVNYHDCDYTDNQGSLTLVISSP